MYANALEQKTAALLLIGLTGEQAEAIAAKLSIAQVNAIVEAFAASKQRQANKTME